MGAWAAAQGSNACLPLAAAARAACDMLHVHSMPCTAVVTGRDTGLPTVPSGTPGPTATPLCGLRGQTGFTLHLSHPTCKPGHTTLPSQAAHPWLLRCKYKGCKIQAQPVYDSCFICSHLCSLHKSSPPVSSSSLPPRLSAQPATAIHHPKAALAVPKGSGCHLPTQPLAVSTDGHNQAVKFPRKLAGWRKREGK